MKYFLSILCILCAFFSISKANTITIVDYPQDSLTTDITRNNSLLLNTLSYELMLLHIKIGNKNSNQEPLDLDTQNGVLKNIELSENLVREDIIETLKIVEDKEEALELYMDKVNTLLDQGNFFIMILEQNISNVTTQREICIKGKAWSDQTYFESIKQYNQTDMIESLQKSSIYSRCIAQNNVQINAQNTLLSKLKWYHTLLQQKYTFIADKKETILKNIGIMQPDFLQELINIKQTLDRYNTNK